MCSTEHTGQRVECKNHELPITKSLTIKGRKFNWGALNFKGLNHSVSTVGTVTRSRRLDSCKKKLGDFLKSGKISTRSHLLGGTNAWCGSAGECELPSMAKAVRLHTGFFTSLMSVPWIGVPRRYLDAPLMPRRA